MMKISDFKLAEHFLMGVSKRFKVPFVDIGITFVPAGQEVGTGLQGDHLVVASDTLGKTLLAIIGGYIHHLSLITGANQSLSNPEQEELLVAATAAVRQFLYAPDWLPQADSTKRLKASLRQFSLVWLILRDLVAPYYRCELEDVPVICGRSAELDAAKLITEGEDSNEAKDAGVDLPMIFLNSEVESNVFKEAFLLVEAIRSLGLDGTRVVSDILSHDDLKDKFFGIVKLAYVDEKLVGEFLTTVATVGNFPDAHQLMTDRSSDVWKKQATFMGNYAPGASWFLPQLTEEQLGSVRHTNGTVPPKPSAYVKELWERVASEKKRRGKEDMALEDLLRVHSIGMRPEPGVTLQQLLSEQRIW